MKRQRGIIEGPLLYVIVGLGVALLLSIAANAWLFHERDKALEAKATAQQLNADTAESAKRCTASVVDLGTKSEQQKTALLSAIRSVAPAIKAYQDEVTLALTATPEDAANLCGSLAKFWADRLPIKERP